MIIIINQIKQKINESTILLEQKESELLDIQENSCNLEEKMFENTYGVHPEKIRSDYVILVNRCVKYCSSGHETKIKGVRNGGSSHEHLLPEHYEVCKPTPLIIKAFSIIGEKIYISEEPKQIHWDN